MSALVEDPVSVEEASTLISKAKTIVEADMGTKVPTNARQEGVLDHDHRYR